MTDYIRLGLNIDHVATIRNARGGRFPDPVRAVHLAIAAGVDGITAHLREDRRHILDDDVWAIKDTCDALSRPLNFEMACTDEMVNLALKLKPHAVCLVPERREERTTEGGLNIKSDANRIKYMTQEFTAASIRTSLFIEPDASLVETALEIGAPVVEFHTGALCDSFRRGDQTHLDKSIEAFERAVLLAHGSGIEVHAGHGIDFDCVKFIVRNNKVRELNIGHFLIGEAIFTGLQTAIQTMRAKIDEA